MRSIAHILATIALFLVAVPDADARNGRQNQVPHGNNFGCEVCHTQAGGLNDFGFDSFDYTNGGTVDWRGLSQEDSDRDGYPNGLELGDPDGNWNAGDASPGGEFSHPGDPMDGLCGNGTFEGEEECEAGQLGDATCGSLGLGAGNLNCSDTCRYDTSGCDTCGDDEIQGGEECDGSDLGGNTCESLGLGTGSLACTGCSYNSVGCSAGEEDSTPETCGDGVRQEGELCDGSDHGGATCESLGYTGGFLGCQVRCIFNTGGCTGGENMTPASENDSAAGESSQPTGGTTEGTSGLAGDPNGGPSAESSINLDGRACTTSPTTPTNPDTLWLLALLGAIGFVTRRSRSTPSH